MPCCGDCINFTPLSMDCGECRIIGETSPDRDSERCPARMFVQKPAKKK